MAGRGKVIELIQYDYEPDDRVRGVRTRVNGNVKYMLVKDDSLGTKIRTVQKLREAARKNPTQKEHVECRRIY